MAVAIARPDIGLKLRQQQLQQQGYNYAPPSTSYGNPIQSNQVFASSQYQQNRIPSGSYIPNGPTLPQVNFNEHSFTGGSTLNYPIGVNGGGFQGLVNNGGNGYANSFSSQFGTTSSQSSLQFQQHAHQQAQLQKHVYFYEAPYEPEEPHIHKHIPVAPATKNYKIIFIKAPTQSPPTVPIIPLQPQNEEKTLVYVLVKKPDEQPDIHIPAPIPTQPSKPEVFFIKYKTQDEAKQKIQGTLEGHQNAGLTANAVGDGAAFVSSIKDSITHHHHGDASGEHGIITNGNFGQDGFGTQFGNTQITSGLNGGSHTGGLVSSGLDGTFTSSSGSVTSTGSLAGTGPHAQYGPPGASGPY